MEESGGMGCHPPAWGFAQLGVCSADDVAVLVHNDLLAIRQGHGITAIADAFQNTAARLLAIKAHNGILEFRRDKFCVYGCSPFLTPKWCGCCNAGCG